MARFLAMRVNQDKLAYKDVPERYIQSVHDILVDEFGWTSEDFEE
jgi:hypothetical protein